MDQTCNSCCNFCYPNNWRDKYVFFSEGCKKVTELPSDLDKIIQLWCGECVNLLCIPPLSSLTDIACNGCPLLTCISKLPNIEYMNLNDCILLTQWKQRGENVVLLSCGNCPLLHLHPSLFIRFNGLNYLDNGIAEGDSRPRNGVSFHLLSAFTVCKKLYCFELPSRVALEVSLNEILYAPGEKKYLELVERYKDGIKLYKKKNSDYYDFI